jgi:hypothetical protein
MKKTLPFFAALIFLFSCHGNGHGGHGNNDSGSCMGSGSTSQYISIDSANKMIKSYLASIPDSMADSNLECVIISADSLRRLVDGTSTSKPTYIKLTFAHTLNYINAGNYGKPCGMKPNAMTVIVSGFTATGNYIYQPYNNMVLDNGTPCPANCPSAGTACADTFCSSRGGQQGHH